MRTATGGWTKGKTMAAILIAVMVMTGCAEKKPEKNPFFEEWRSRAEQSQGYSPSPTPAKIPSPDAEPQKLSHAVRDKKEVPMETPLQPTEPKSSRVEAPALPTKRISLKVQDLAVVTLLRVLARAAEQNILISEKVNGKTTVSVNDMPWDKVFLGILKTNGLTYAWEGDILRIITLEDLVQEEKLADALQKKAAKEKEFQLRMNSLKTQARMVEPLQTWVYHVKYAEIKTLRDNLDRFFKASRSGNDVENQEKANSKIRGAILVDPHTNSLVVQAIESDIARLKETVALLDVPTKQVLIEAFIVQATDNTARDLGVQWGGSFKNSGQYVNIGSNSSEDLWSALDEDDNTIGFPSTISADGLTLGYISQKVGRNLLSVQLSALETQGKLNILSHPSITTLDNQKAIIESGTEIPYQTEEDNTTTTEYKKATLSLEVTPYVVDGTTLKLSIKTKKDEPESDDQEPRLITRRAETNVVLFDGETTVIGGLSEKKMEDDESGIPWLKDIPGLGRLFRSNSKNNSFDELLIFITPHILKEKMGVAASEKRSVP